MRTLHLFVLSAMAVGIAMNPVRVSADIVYLGQDSSVHWQFGDPEAITLGTNAARVAAGGLLQPTVAVFTGSVGFGADVVGMLTAGGISAGNITAFSSASIGAVTFSDFQVLYFAPTTDSGDIASYAASSASILAYATSGGGIVVEPEVFAPLSWTWVPFAALIGHSGAANVSTDDVTIVAPLDPLAAGLTDAGLSNWGFSVHTTFATPGLAGFTPVAEQLGVDGLAVDIVLHNGQAAVPEPSTLALLGFGSLALAAYRRRRMSSQKA